MEFDNHVLLVISIGFLISSISVQGSNPSPFWSIADEVKQTFGPALNEAEDAIGPVSSIDLDKAEDALGPIPSLDEAKEAIAPIQSLDDAKSALAPVLDDAKEKLGPISPSTVKEAKSVTTKALDKVEEGIDSIASLFKQNKLDVSSYLENAEKEFGPISSDDLNKAKEALGPISPSLEKAGETLPPISPSAVDEAKDKLGPIISPAAVDEAKDAIGQVSPEVVDEAKEKFGSIASLFTQNKQEIPESSSVLSESERELSPISPSTLNEAKEAAGSYSFKALDEAKGKFGSLSSLISQNKEEISPDSSSSIFAEAEKELGPIFSSDEDASSPVLSLNPISPSTYDEVSQNKEEISDEEAPSVAPSSLDEAEEAIGSLSSKALDEAKEAYGSIKSFFSHNKMQISSPVSLSTFDEARDAMDSSSDLDEAEDKFGSISSFFTLNKEELSSTSVIYIDHDVALAIESLIKQGQSNSKLALEEAGKQLSLSETIATPDRGTCVKPCLDNYAHVLDSFTKAMQELKDRNAELLTSDIGSVEGEISSCQKCYLESKEEKQSSLKDLEEAILKSTRECLNVVHHLG